MKKFLSFLLCGSIIASNSLLVFANTVTSTGEHEVTVEGEVLSTFEVVLPTSISLQSGQPSTDVDITVTKNTAIGNDEILSVTPEEVIYLSKNNSKELVKATIYQDKTKFMGTEVGVEDITTTCTIETGRLSSGVYNGTLKFNIELTGDNAIIVDGEVRTWNWLVYNDYFAISEEGVLTKGTADLSELEGTLNIGNKVKTIDTKAFEGSNISTIVIGPSVETINDAAFMSINGLTSIEVDKDNETFSSIDGVLFSKDGTKLIAYPAGNLATDYKIASNVTEIGNYAFAYCANITSLTVPSTVVKTGQGAFKDMSVVSSRYDITKNMDDDTRDASLINSDTGSILMAKKVNGYTTWATTSLETNIPIYRTTTLKNYVNDSTIKKVLSVNSFDVKISYYNNSMNYITSIDGETCNNYTYGGVDVYGSDALENLTEYKMSFAHYDFTNQRFKYNPSPASEACEFNCSDIVYSEVDIYDADNNLIYKADIKK